jgi:hypothetical protein
MKFMVFFLGGACLFAALTGFKLDDFSFNRLGSTADKVFHAHYTAGLIEDEIRRVRSEDYAYRKKYEELKQENIGN